MPDQTLSPSQVASQVGASVHTVRRWCEAHSAYLSPSANPAKGISRRLTQTDVEVLAEVSRLRTEEALATDAINERLAGVIFGQTTAIGIPLGAAPASPVASGAAIVPAVVVDSLQAIETRLTALEAQRQRLDVAYLVAIAFIAGLLLGLAMWWFR